MMKTKWSIIPTGSGNIEFDKVSFALLGITGIGGYPEYMQNDMRDYLAIHKQALELAKINADEEINNAYQNKIEGDNQLDEDFMKSLLFSRRVDEIYLKIQSDEIEKDGQYDRYNDVVCLFKLREEFSDKLRGLYGGVMSVLIPKKSLLEKKFEDVFISFDFD